MTTQSKALILAERLQSGADDPMWADHIEMPKSVAIQAAHELRRLHQQYRSAIELIQSIAYEPHELSLDKAYDQRNWMTKTCRTWLQQNIGDNT